MTSLVLPMRKQHFKKDYITETPIDTENTLMIARWEGDWKAG